MSANIDPTAASAWVRRRVDDGSLPSAVFGIATSAGTQLIEAFGATGNRPAEMGDYFSLYSVTKPLVGLATVRAIEQGTLSLSAPLVDAIPEFGYGRADEVLLHHLLSHTAGIHDEPLDSPTPVREQLVNGSQEFTAGTMVRYSNVAFEGVAALVEHSTGHDVYHHVSALSALSSAGGITFDSGCDPHEVQGGERVGLDPASMMRQRHPAAGAFSDAETLLDLSVELLKSSSGAKSALVAPSSLSGMLVPRTLGLPEPIVSTPRRDFGLTWHLRAGSPGLLERNVFGHAGWSGTQWWIYPEHDAAFVLLTNVLDMRGLGVDEDELNNAFSSGLPTR
jgi:CubicO group peptidase (beta-lactamase class C family)